MSDALLTTLRKLRLSGLSESLEIRLHEAATSGLSHRDFLELLLQDELMVRNSRLLSRRTTAANFRDVRRWEDFDFGFNPSIKKDRLFDLATYRVSLGAPTEGAPVQDNTTPAGLILQDSGHAVEFRNIWLCRWTLRPSSLRWRRASTMIQLPRHDQVPSER